MNQMFSLSLRKKAYALGPSLFRLLDNCPSSCPEDTCLVDCECKSESECPKDFTIILIVIASVITGLLFVSGGCYLYYREKKERKLAGLQVVQINRRSERELADLNNLDSSIANLRVDPLDISVANNGPPTANFIDQVGIPINIPGSPCSPVEDSSIVAVASNLQVEVADKSLPESENNKPNDISVIKDMTHINQEHNKSNIIIHKIPLTQQDDFEIIEEDKVEKEEKEEKEKKEKKEEKEEKEEKEGKEEKEEEEEEETPEKLIDELFPDQASR